MVGIKKNATFNTAEVGLGAIRHRCSRNEEEEGGGGRVRKGLVREKVVVGWGGFGFGERKDGFRKAGTVAMWTWCGRLFFLVGVLRWG